MFTYHSEVGGHDGSHSPTDHEYMLTCKKRVVQFIQRWVIAVRHAVFEDPSASEFIEVGSEIMPLNFQFQISAS